MAFVWLTPSCPLRDFRLNRMLIRKSSQCNLGELAGEMKSRSLVRHFHIVQRAALKHRKHQKWALKTANAFQALRHRFFVRRA